MNILIALVLFQNIPHDLKLIETEMISFQVKCLFWYIRSVSISINALLLKVCCILIQGIKHIIFYGPPTNLFYSDIVNMISNTSDFSDCTCELLFSKFDVLALERIVGSARVERLINSPKEAFMFSN
jgi:hypothetical protein